MKLVLSTTSTAARHAEIIVDLEMQISTALRRMDSLQVSSMEQLALGLFRVSGLGLMCRVHELNPWLQRIPKLVASIVIAEWSGDVS